MKGGTTSLYRYLATHPETVPPSTKKEPMYFRTDQDFSKGLDWYGGLFSHKKGRYAFEASTSYTRRHRFTNVPARIKSAIPNVRLVYLVRDPIDRIVSQYVHQYATRWETNSLSDAIRNDPEYIATSRYHYQITPYLDHFDRSQIHIATLEDLKANPAATLRELSDFLGISYDFDESLYGTSFNASSEKLRTSEREIELRDAAPHPLIASAVVRFMKRYRTPFERPTLSGEDEAFLVEQLREDVAAFRELIGLPFGLWRDY